MRVLLRVRALVLVALLSPVVVLSGASGQAPSEGTEGGAIPSETGSSLVEPATDGAPAGGVDEPSTEDAFVEGAAVSSGEDDEASPYAARATLVVGAPEAPRRATSDFAYDVDAFRAVPRRTAERLLSLAPGLVLANHSGIGHAASIYLRGFDAGEGQDLAMEVEGVELNEPSNPHAHGYADPGFLPVEIVHRVVVQEGPFDPRQPTFSIAGTARYELGVAERGVRLAGRYGSFQTWRALAIVAPEGQSDGTFVAVDAVGGNGFGPNRAHRSMRIVGRYEHREDGVEWSFFGAAHAQRFDSAGVIPLAAYDARTLPCAPSADAQFFCLVDPNQGGAAQRYLSAFRVAVDRPGWTLDQTFSLGFRDDRFQDDFTGIAQYPMGDGLDQAYRALTAALRGAYRLKGRFLGSAQTLELGWLGRHDEGSSSMARQRFSDGVPYALVFDTDLRLTELAAYALADFALGRYVSLQGGVRLEAFLASVTHHGLPTSDREGPRLPDATVDAFGFVGAPRGVLTVHPHETLDVVLSSGIGTRPVDAQGLSNAESAPFTKVVGTELGILHRLALGEVSLVSRGTLFATWIADDLVFDPNAGRNVSIGPTRRYGGMLSALLTLARKVDAQASVTYAEAHKTASGAPAFDLASGPQIPYVPRLVGRIDVAYHDTLRVHGESLGVSAGLGGTFLGKKPLPYGQLSPRTTVFDLGGELRYRFVAIELLVENLFDARYHAFDLSAVADFSPVDGSTGGSMRPQRLFAAGAPRTVFVTLSFTFDPSRFTDTP